MKAIAVYTAEKEAGLASLIREQVFASLAGKAELCEKFQISEQAIAKMGRALGTNLGQPDLHYLNSVLVTAGWTLREDKVPAGFNNNDDFFDVEETWAARHTPEDKPFNYEHVAGDVIGHITDNLVIGSDGKAVVDDTAVDALPGSFHIVTGSVLYKYWGDDEVKQKRMDQVIAEIGDDKWFISMEAYFTGFDYVALGKDGTARVIARNNQTAFLTKALRAYGGTGMHDGQKIGRLLRNITFSGKGLVKKPANPASIILKSSAKLSQESKTLGYQSLTGENTMSVDLEKTIAEQKALIEKLQADARENDVKAVKASLDKALETNVSVQKSLDEAIASLKTITSERDAIKKNLDEVCVAMNTAAKERDELKAEKTKADRIKLVIEKLKASEDKAKALVESVLNLSDEQFATHVEAMTAWVSTNPAEGNTNFGEKKAQPAPKGTDAPLPPKSTNQPAPMAGKGSTEVDVKGEETVVTTSLEQVETKNEPALATETDPASEGVRKAIAEHFGYKTQE